MRMVGIARVVVGDVSAQISGTIKNKGERRKGDQGRGNKKRGGGKVASTD